MNFENALQYIRTNGFKNHEIAIKVTADSRQVQTGDVFVAISGNETNGAKYIEMAINAGAKYIVCEPSAKLSLDDEYSKNCIVHDSPRTALWQLASACYATEDIWQEIKVIGITGTNGKTTSAYLLEHLFSKAGYAVGVIGTVSYRWPGHEEEAPLTTPDSASLHSMLRKMYDAKVKIVIMEVSSHALEQERVGGIDFSGALFSNLTQDHLDYHNDMQSYFNAKAMLFTKYPLAAKAIALNTDDTWGQKLVEQLSKNVNDLSKIYSFGLNTETKPLCGQQHLQGQIQSMSTKGLELKITLSNDQGQRSWNLYSPLVGAFNAANLLAVQSLALGIGLKVDDLQHLSSFYGVCGRLERVVNTQDLAVFVDYAHTPDALTNVLQALQGAGFTKIITVFGCGGNRDKTKRPLMGKAVADLSQVAVVTSDNPRFEEPQAILDDVLPGLQNKAELEIHIEVDRRLATEKALEILLASDDKAAVLIAGKGHEDYQIIQGVKYPYSDQATVQEILACK